MVCVLNVYLEKYVSLDNTRNVENALTQPMCYKYLSIDQDHMLYNKQLIDKLYDFFLFLSRSW